MKADCVDISSAEQVAHLLHRQKVGNSRCLWTWWCQLGTVLPANMDWSVFGGLWVGLQGTQLPFDSNLRYEIK